MNASFVLSEHLYGSDSDQSRVDITHRQRMLLLRSVVVCVIGCGLRQHTILEFNMKPSVLESTPLSAVRVKDPNNFVKLEELYLGGRVTASLQKYQNLNKQQLDTFKLGCLDFYIEGASQILQRFNLSDSVFTNLKALDPQSVLMKTIPSVAPLAAQFPNLVSENDLNEIDGEWRLVKKH